METPNIVNESNDLHDSRAEELVAEGPPPVETESDGDHELSVTEGELQQPPSRIEQRCVEGAVVHKPGYDDGQG